MRVAGKARFRREGDEPGHRIYRPDALARRCQGLAIRRQGCPRNGPGQVQLDRCRIKRAIRIAVNAAAVIGEGVDHNRNARGIAHQQVVLRNRSAVQRQDGRIIVRRRQTGFVRCVGYGVGLRIVARHVSLILHRSGRHIACGQRVNRRKGGGVFGIRCQAGKRPTRHHNARQWVGDVDIGQGHVADILHRKGIGDGFACIGGTIAVLIGKGCSFGQSDARLLGEGNADRVICGDRHVCRAVRGGAADRGGVGTGPRVDIGLKQHIRASDAMGFTGDKGGVRQKIAAQQRVADDGVHHRDVASVGHIDHIVDGVACILHPIAVGIGIGRGLDQRHRRAAGQRRGDAIIGRDGRVVRILAADGGGVDHAPRRRIQIGLRQGVGAVEGAACTRQQGCNGANKRRRQFRVIHGDGGQRLVARVGDNKGVIHRLAQVGETVAVGINHKAGLVQGQRRGRQLRDMCNRICIGDRHALRRSGFGGCGVVDHFGVNISLRDNIRPAAFQLVARGKRDRRCDVAGQRGKHRVFGSYVGQRLVPGVVHHQRVGDGLPGHRTRSGRGGFIHGECGRHACVHCGGIGGRFHRNRGRAERRIDRRGFCFVQHKTTVKIGLSHLIARLTVHHSTRRESESPPCTVKAQRVAVHRADLVVVYRDIPHKGAGARVRDLIVIGDHVPQRREGAAATRHANHRFHDRERRRGASRDRDGIAWRGDEPVRRCRIVGGRAEGDVIGADGVAASTGDACRRQQAATGQCRAADAGDQVVTDRDRTGDRGIAGVGDDIGIVDGVAVGEITRGGLRGRFVNAQRRGAQRRNRYRVAVGRNQRRGRQRASIGRGGVGERAVVDVGLRRGMAAARAGQGGIRRNRACRAADARRDQRVVDVDLRGDCHVAGVAHHKLIRQHRADSAETGRRRCGKPLVNGHRRALRQGHGGRIIVCRGGAAFVRGIGDGRTAGRGAADGGLIVNRPRVDVGLQQRVAAGKGGAV